MRPFANRIILVTPVALSSRPNMKDYLSLMKKGLPFFAAWILGSLILPPAGFSLTVGSDNLAFDGVAVDGNQRLFAFNRSRQGQLDIFEDGQWKVLRISPDWEMGESTPSQLSARPCGLFGLTDGRIASVWAVEDKEWILAIIDDRRIIQTFKIPWDLNLGKWFDFKEDSRGDIWLSSRIPTFVRCRPSDGTVRAFNLSPLAAPGAPEAWNAVKVTEDGQGRIWIWTQFSAEREAGLPGLVRVVDDELQPHPKISGMTDSRLMTVEPRDENSFWVKNWQSRFYSLDLETFAATQISLPDPYVGEMFRFGSGWLVLGGLGYERSIWQFSEGQWQLRLPGETYRFSDWKDGVPSYAELDSGALFSGENGLIYVPRDGSESRLLNWRQGCPLTRTGQILPIDGDHFIALSRSDSPPRWMLGNLPEILTDRRVAPAVDIQSWRGWAVDSQDRIYTLLRKNPQHLDFWEEGQWRTLPLPKGLDPGWLSLVARDAKDRIWLSSGIIDKEVAILEADRETWVVLPDFRTALAKFSDGLTGLFQDLDWLRPIPGPNGAIAFRTQEWQITHWNGREWQTAGIADIVPEPRGDRVSTPFFDSAGRLSVNTIRTQTTWKLEEGKWTPHPPEPGIPDRWSNNRPLPDPKVPAELRQKFGASRVARDNLGAVWTVGNGNLYKHYRGKTVAIFDSSQSLAHPFLSNPSIQSARVDRFGNTWIEFNAARHVLLPGQPSEIPQ